LLFQDIEWIESNITSDYERLRKGENHKQIIAQDMVIFSVVRSSLKCLSTPCCGVPVDKGCTQPLSSDPKIKLECHSSSFYQDCSRSQGISISCSRLQAYIRLESQIRVREGESTSTRDQNQQLNIKERNTSAHYTKCEEQH
jgi:hypothetical protein